MDEKAKWNTAQDLNGNWGLKWQTMPVAWMPCQAYSKVKGFGQVQKRHWAEPGNSECKKLRPARQMKEADEDNHTIHALFISPR